MPAAKKKKTGTEPTDNDDDLLLLDELQGHNAFFDNLVDMIPAKLYVSGNTGDEMYNPKYHKGQHKESKEARKARNKAAKLAKFDPTKAETTLQIKERKAREEAEQSDDDNHHDSTASSDVEHMHDAETPAAGTERGGTGQADEAALSSAPPTTNTESSSSTTAHPSGNISKIEALREKLRAKIAEKRALRPGGGGENADSPAEVSKRAARRAQKRKLEAAKAAAAGSSSNSNKKKKTTTQVGKDDRYSTAMMFDAGGGMKVNASTILQKTNTTASGNTTRTMEEDLSGIDFGKIAGLTQTPHYLDNKSLTHNAAGLTAKNKKKKKKSLERLLEEAEKKRQRLEELKNSKEKEDKEKAEKIQWGDAIKEASGERVHDDPALLKKAIKRKARKKAKSAKAWESRLEQTKESMSERQKIRSHNLEKRKVGGVIGANLSRKRIVTEEEVIGGGGTEEGETGRSGGEVKKRRRLGPHSGKGRAGFEGKKQDFLNKGKVGGGTKAQ